METDGALVPLAILPLAWLLWMAVHIPLSILIVVK
jgi:hypothetical protein